MILDFTKKTVAPGVVSIQIKGSMHTGPDCMRLVKEIDGLIPVKETRVIFDLAELTHADSAAIGALAGGGAGTAGAAFTGKKDIVLPADTRLHFKLAQPLSVPAPDASAPGAPPATN